jgi:hypothetical protein
MANEEYYVEEKKIDGILLLLLFTVGWLGFEKFYAGKTFRRSWKFWLVKFLYCLIGVGLIWNIFDIVQAFRKKYQLDFREYFR